MAANGPAVSIPTASSLLHPHTFLPQPPPATLPTPVELLLSGDIPGLAENTLHLGPLEWGVITDTGLAGGSLGGWALGQEALKPRQSGPTWWWCLL